MSYTPNMTCAKVLYNNILRTTPLVYSGTAGTIDGFEYVHAYDWRDFSLYRLPDSTSGVFTMTLSMLGGSRSFDTLCIWPLNPSVSGSAPTIHATITVNGSTVFSGVAGQTGRATWTSLGAVTTVTPGDEVVLTVSASGTTFDIRQIALGTALVFPTGQWADLNPPKLTQGLIVENVISVNGSIIGRNVRRTERTGEIKLDYLDQSWVRNQWDAFAVHASKYAFFYLWSPVLYPDEVAFAVADTIVAPTNSKAGRMKASMPIKFLV